MPLIKTSFVLMCLGAAAIAMPSPPAWAIAAQAAAATPARLLGTVTAVNGNTITLKADSGTVATVMVSDTTRMVRTEPGQKDLSAATPIHAQDLAVGDRVLVRATPGSSENTYTAQLLIAMKHSDIAQQQLQQQQDWQKRGVGGIVKSVDASSGTVIVLSGTRTLTIHTTPKTVVRRYAQDSVKFDDAKISMLDQIKPGDQLRARGDHGADGAEVTADEIVAGSFRNIAGQVLQANAGAQTLTVMDLATKKPITVHFTPDSQLHKLEPQMAQMIAARLKGGTAGEHRAGAEGQPPAGSQGTISMNGQGSHRGGDLSQILQRAPSVQLADLHPGDAVMIVSTEGASNTATAIELLAGVEPMLQASTKASQSLFSSSWSLGGGSEASGAAQQ